MAGRRLEDVFDYFVSPEEQQAARDSVRPRGAEPQTLPTPPTRWCVAIEPSRLLHCTLAVELAAGLARDGRRSLVLSSFERPALVPRSSSGGWEGAGSAWKAAFDARADAHLVAAARPDEARDVVAALGVSRLGGLMLTADARPGGLRSVLGQLRRLAAPAELRIGAVLLGATANESDTIFRVLEGAARRQLGRTIERLGVLRADAASHRALLRGCTTLDLDPESESASQILELCSRLRTPP